MKHLLFLILNVLYIQFVTNDVMTIDLRIDGFEAVTTNEYMLNGELIFNNKSSRAIKLPKTFDLEIILTDSLGKKINKKSDFITEYHNLIMSKNRLTIKPQGKLIICFSEWRLFLYDLQHQNKYNLQYILTSTKYDVLNKRLGGQEIISTKTSFIYQ